MTSAPEDQTLSDQTLSDQHRALGELLATVEQQFLPLTDEQAQWKPASDRWSVAEVFDHLHVTGEQYAQRMNDALESTIAQGWKAEDQPYRPTLMGRFFVRALGGKMKVKAPKGFQPAQAEGDLHTLEEYVSQQRELQAFMERADGYSISRARFASPVTRLMRFNIGDGIRMMVIHQQRHLRQALAVMEEAGFPR